MTERKYEDLITTITYEGRDLWDEDSDHRLLYGPAMYCAEKDPKAPIFIDVMQLLKSDTGFGLGAKAIMNGDEILETPHKHGCAEIFAFIGTDPENPADLGGEIEMWIGEGDEAEKYTFTEPTFVYIPAGVTHQPTWAKEVRRPIFCLDILMSPSMDIEPVPVLPSEYTGPERFRDRMTA